MLSGAWWVPAVGCCPRPSPVAGGGSFAGRSCRWFWGHHVVHSVRHKPGCWRLCALSYWLLFYVCSRFGAARCAGALGVGFTGGASAGAVLGCGSDVRMMAPNPM